MGDALSKVAFFPAPEPSSAQNAAWTQDIVWDLQARGTPGGGVKRPFLWLQTPGILTTIIYFHGNGEDLSMCSWHLRVLRKRLSVNILAVEYPGYGLLSDDEYGPRLNCAAASQYLASTTVEGIDLAGVHALRFLGSKGITAGQMLLHGHSIGCGPALRLAKYAQDNFGWSVGGVVLQSPFISIARVVSDYAGAAATLIVPNYYDNMELLRDLCNGLSTSIHRGSNQSEAWDWIPLLIIHGEKDEIIAPYHGRALVDEARRQGHPAVEASFPKDGTHSHFANADDLATPIEDFMHRYLSKVPLRTGHAGCFVSRPRYIAERQTVAAVGQDRRVVAVCGEAAHFCPLARSCVIPFAGSSYSVGEERVQPGAENEVLPDVG